MPGRGLGYGEPCHALSGAARDAVDVRHEHAVSAIAPDDDGVQVVTMSEGSRGYSPADTVVYAGVPIRWEITAESQFTCAAAMRGVGSDFSVDLKTGANVVELAAMKPGTFSFVCAMGMYSGTLTAVDANGTTATQTLVFTVK